jgi:hypothetical protein
LFGEVLINTRLELTRVEPLMGRLPTFPTNIGLSWKWLAV